MPLFFARYLPIVNGMAKLFKKLLFCPWLAFPSPSYLATVAVRGERNAARVLGVSVRGDRGYVQS